MFTKKILSTIISFSMLLSLTFPALAEDEKHIVFAMDSNLAFINGATTEIHPHHLYMNQVHTSQHDTH